MNDRFNLRYVYKNKIYDVYAVDFGEGKAQLVSLDGSEMLFTKIDTDKLFQCTGLRDKNGKLVYEGDILLYPDEYCRRNRYKIHLEIVWVNGEFRAQGSFTTKGSCIQFRDYCLNGFTLENGLMDIEVIGNIYENPELLEE